MEIYRVHNSNRDLPVAISAPDGDTVIIEPRVTKLIDGKFVNHILPDVAKFLTITRAN